MFLEITPAPVQVGSGSLHNAVSGSPTRTFQKTQLDVSSALLLCWISKISLAFSAMGKSKKGDTGGKKKKNNSTFSNFTKMYGQVSELIGSLPGVGKEWGALTHGRHTLPAKSAAARTWSYSNLRPRLITPSIFECTFTFPVPDTVLFTQKRLSKFLLN